MEKQLYELTQGQKLLQYATKNIRFTEIMNIVIEFTIESEVDLHLLMQAVNLVALRNPNNSIRLIEKDQKIYQYFTDDAQDKIEYLVFDKESDYEKYLIKFAKTPFPNKNINTQLYKLNVVRKPNGKVAVCGCFSHIIYDAYSSIVVFKEISEIYIALRDNTPLPEEPISPIEAYKLEDEYLESDKLEKDRAFYESVFDTQPQYTDLRGVKSKGHIKNSKFGKATFMCTLSFDGGQISYLLDKEFVDAVNKYSTEHRVSVQTIYTLALKTYLSIVNETDDVVISSIVNNRNKVVQKKCGGTMADALKLRLNFGTDLSFKDAIDYLYKRTMEFYKHSSFGVQRIEQIINSLYDIKQTESYGSTMFTYQNDFNINGDIKYSYRHISPGKEWDGCYLTIMPCDSEGNYIADYCFIKDIVKEEDINNYHKFMIDFIKEGLNNDELLIRDIIEKVGK